MKQPSDMTDRELDAAVAVEVMGLCPCGDPRLFAKGSGLPGSPAPRYSTDIAAAFSCLHHLKDRFQPSLWKPIRSELDEAGGGRLMDVFEDDWKCILVERITSIQQMQYCERASTPERAIALTALAAVRGKK